MGDCPHDNTDTVIGSAGPETTCSDCGEWIDADGPMDDDWITAAYERPAPPTPDPWAAYLEELR